MQKIIIIAGPTASGKTSISINLAEKLDGEIISADSVQVYRYMDIGSAKPTLEERRRVAHHLIDVRDPDEDFSAGDYVREARERIAELAVSGRVPIVAGGTGLYIRLLIGGIVETPAARREIRERLMKEENALGTGTLFSRLELVDPVTAGKTSPRNLVRIIRALEVYETTGIPLSRLKERHLFGDRPYNTLFIGLCPERKLLYEWIDKRVDGMIHEGLLGEVEGLLSRGWGRDLNSMKSLGYRHIAAVPAGEMGLEEAVGLMKRDTRHYAKRQLTWFRSEPGVLWFDPKDSEGIGSAVSYFLEH
jgi:tRNA dimethylallyltransferase